MTSALNSFLAERSGLTPAQIETANLQQRVLKGEFNVRMAASSRGPDGVTEGAYYRVLAQARDNVEKAIFTLLLSQRLGYVKAEDLRKLFDMVSATPSDLSQEDRERVAGLVEVLVRKVVIL